MLLYATKSNRIARKFALLREYCSFASLGPCASKRRNNLQNNNLGSGGGIMARPPANYATTHVALFSNFRIFTIRTHCEVASILSWTAGHLLDDLADIEPFRCNLYRLPPLQRYPIMCLPIRVAWLTVHAYLAVSVGLDAAEQIDLSPQHEPGRLTQVSVELEAAGSTIVRTDAKDSAQKASDR